MATVYEVSEATTARRLALKRLHPLEDARKHRRAVQLFEREYHTLSQLAHPRVVEVFDYGVDGVGPYYTMELLDGGDLRRRRPCPGSARARWRATSARRSRSCTRGAWSIAISRPATCAARATGSPS
jgi:serine/threonine protein kinase